MHDLSELGTSIPAFLAKLWKIVDDPETDHLICWSDGGTSFVIHNTVRFMQELLPMYYKHNNMASFVRQLNMYGFRKVTSIESGSLKNEKEAMEFAHTCFVKGHPYLMENIKRKLPISRNAPTLAFVSDLGKDVKGLAQTEILAQVLSDVNNLKSKQASWDAKLASMKRENEALWRELAIFRQKHHKQAKIINKLIQFIVTMVRPSGRNVPIRRRYPLMLSSGEQGDKSVSGLSGPTIRELDPVELFLGDSDADDSSLERAVRLQPEDNENISNFVEVDLPLEEEENATSSLGGGLEMAQLNQARFESGPGLIRPVASLVDNNQSYVVVSPAEAETEPDASMMFHLDGTAEETEAAMTPINPVDVNPSVVSNPLIQFINVPQKPALTGSQKHPILIKTPHLKKNRRKQQDHLGKSQIVGPKQWRIVRAAEDSKQRLLTCQPAMQPSKMVKNIKLSAPIAEKKSRKNAQPKKVLCRSPKNESEQVTEKDEEKYTLDEALNLIGSADLELPSLATPNPIFPVQQLDLEDNGQIQKLLKKSVAQPPTTINEQSVLSLQHPVKLATVNPQKGGKSTSLKTQKGGKLISDRKGKATQSQKLNKQINIQENLQEGVMKSSVINPQGTFSSVLDPVQGSSFSGLSSDEDVDQFVDPNAILDPKSMAVVRPNTSYHADDVARYVQPMDLGSHVDMVQGDLDILKEFLKSDGCSLDANALLELFNDDPMSLIMPPPSDNKDSKQEGNELMTYSSPNLSDLMDMYGSTPCLEGNDPPSPSLSMFDTPIMTPASPGFPPPTKRRRK